MAGTVEKKLAELGITLPTPNAPVANYIPFVRVGALLFVPFKSNSIAGEAGTLWEKMFHYYNFRREDFLKHYHQRSNVESAFSMMKRKFGDGLRSKTDVAMVNETLCKILCHNLVVLIHEMCELGLDPVFWPNTN